MERSIFVQDAMATIQPMLRADGINLDQSGTLFLERELESLEERVYRQKLRELKHRRLIPISTRDPEGSETITYKLFSKVGIAKFVSDDPDDIPMADAFATRHTASVRLAATGFKFTTQELRRAAMTNVSIEVEKSDSARRAMEELEARVAWLGDASHDLLGLTNNPNVAVEQVALNQATTSRLWTLKSPQEIIDDVVNFISNIRVDSREVHSGPYTLGLPIPQHELIRNKRISDNFPTKTVRQYLLDETGSNGINRIEGVPEFDGIGPSGDDVMMAWEADSEVVEQRIPMMMRMLAPQQRGLSFVIFLEQEMAGVVIRFPLGVRQAHGI